MSEPTRLQATAPTEDDRKWLDFAREEEQKTPARFEEAAKFLAGIVSVSLTIFIDKRPAALADWTQGVLTVAAVLWMLSVVGAFAVLFPFRYRFRATSPEDIRRAHRRAATVKRWLLFASTALFVAALGTAVFAFTKGWQPPAPAPMEKAAPASNPIDSSKNQPVSDGK